MPRLRIRYSIRAMLLMMAIVPVLFYYALLPWTNARCFIQAVHDGRSEAAIQMLQHAPFGSHSLAITSHYEMRVEPISIAQIWNGEAIVYADVPLDWDMPGGTWFRATRHGIEPGSMTW